jgi:hypothetical protein
MPSVLAMLHNHLTLLNLVLIFLFFKFLVREMLTPFSDENFVLCEWNPETFPPEIITIGSITGTLKQSRIVYDDSDSPTP